MEPAIPFLEQAFLEVLGRIVDRIKTLPVLLIVTFRPEFNAPWVGPSQVTSMTLNRLGALGFRSAPMCR
jgi:predicted ATPase